MNVAEHPQVLERQRANGRRTYQEFAFAGSASLALPHHAKPPASPPGCRRKGKPQGVLPCLSRLMGLLVHAAGILVAIPIWRPMKKDRYPNAALDGKIAANRPISYTVNAGTFGRGVVVSPAVLLLVFALGRLFAVMGAMSTTEGLVGPNPLSLSIIR